MYLKNRDEVKDKSAELFVYRNRFELTEHRYYYFSFRVFDIWNIVGHILGWYNDQAVFSTSKHIFVV